MGKPSKQRAHCRRSGEKSVESRKRQKYLKDGNYWSCSNNEPRKTDPEEEIRMKTIEILGRPFRFLIITITSIFFFFLIYSS